MARVEKPSRLSKSASDLRETLQTRNLYTEFKQYPPEPDQTQEIVGSISAVVEAVQPFRSVDLKNSAFARLITLPNTPLTDIGLIMLGKQFGLNFSSNLAQQTFPTFKPLNLFSKDSKVFEKNENYNITNNQRVSGETNIGAYLQKFLSFTKSENPLPVKVTNSELMERTGKGQLDFLFGDGKTYGGINQNIYKPGDTQYFRTASINNLDINDRGDIVNPDGKIWFNFLSKKFNPYFKYSINNQSQETANKAMINAYNLAVFGSNTTFRNQEYMPEQSNVDTFLGKTENRLKGDFINSDGDIPEFNNFHLDNSDALGLDQQIDDQIVWGKDGVDEDTNERLKTLRGLNTDNEFYDINNNDNVDFKFNGKTGLLAYTKNLLNATNGKLIDQTRKVFEDGKGNLQGFNGSGIWNSNNSRYAQENGFNDKKGIRQHSPLDQYDRFAKAIRFKGNSGYVKDGNNEDSVLYESVLPRIHPVFDKETGVLNNRNLTLSIENLAVHVVGDNNQAFVDDDFGTEIPFCEKGPFGGRLMWFPPYGLELNETANAKYDPTVMVGRSEPLYTYQYSERSANLSFIMLMDHPPQLKNYRGGTNKDIAEFFAFGGDNYEAPSIIKDIEKLEFELTIKIKELEDFGVDSYPNKQLPQKIEISFPNDKPTDGEINSIINDMYNNYHYEINEQILSSDGTSFGLNSDIYLFSGVTLPQDPSEKYTGTIPEIDQYGAPFVINKRDLDDAIYNLFNKEDDRKFFKIVVEAGASKLFNGPNEEKYNEELGRRRAEATKFFIESRIKAIFGPSALKDENRIRVEFAVGDGSTGSENANPANATEEAIPKEETKIERYSEIRFENTNIAPSTTKRKLTAEEEQRRIQIEITIDILKKRIRELRSSQFSDCTYEERKANNLSNQDDGILHAYQAIIDGKFYPAFHSQTPEDFHKRLTFLHQCTRQGRPQKQIMTKDENGIQRAKNSVFGRQPICILRIGDFMYTKVVIETITFDYVDATWDLNPEGFGMQPMLAKVNVQMKVIGGQSLKGPIDALQNAVSYNYYANSTYSNKGIYILPSYIAAAQDAYNNGVSYSDFQKSEIAEEFNSKAGDNLRRVNLIKEKEDSNQD